MNFIATNFKRLNSYNFESLDLESVIFFEWLIIKMKSFSFQEFRYSFPRIQKEIGIKRRKLESIIQKLEKRNLLITDVRGMPKVHHFLVNIHEITKPTTIRTLFKESAQIDAYKYFQELSDHAEACRKLYEDDWGIDPSGNRKYLPPKEPADHWPSIFQITPPQLD